MKEREKLEKFFNSIEGLNYDKNYNSEKNEYNKKGTFLYEIEEDKESLKMKVRFYYKSINEETIDIFKKEYTFKNIKEDDLEMAINQFYAMCNHLVFSISILGDDSNNEGLKFLSIKTLINKGI